MFFSITASAVNRLGVSDESPEITIFLQVVTEPPSHLHWKLIELRRVIADSIRNPVFIFSDFSYETLFVLPKHSARGAIY